MTKEEVNAAVKAQESETLKYLTDPIVSSDVIGTSYGSLFDSLATQIVEANGKQLVKVLAWYDNEMELYISTCEKLLKNSHHLLNNKKKRQHDCLFFLFIYNRINDIKRMVTSTTSIRIYERYRDQVSKDEACFNVSTKRFKVSRY